jgi:DNA repair protein RadA/Sms
MSKEAPRKSRKSNTKHPEETFAGSAMRIDVGSRVEQFGTNILQFDVPAELDTQVPTGIKWLDDSLGGGYTPSCVSLVTGGPGAGKTTLAVQLADSLTGQGHVVMFCGSEEAVVQTRKITRRLGCKHGFIVDDNDLVDRCPTWKNDERKTLLDHFWALRKRYPNDRIVIILDSLQSHDDGWYYNGYTNSKTQVRVAEKLAGLAKSKDAGYPVVLLIGQVTKNGDFAGPQQLKHAIDMHQEIKIDTVKDSATRGKRLHTIVKNRFGCTGMTHILNMVSSGLVEDGVLSDLPDA